MPLPLDTITIEVDPMLQLGPLTLAWHGVATAAGIVAAALAGAWWSLRRGRADRQTPGDDGGRTWTVRSAS